MYTSIRLNTKALKILQNYKSPNSDTLHGSDSNVCTSTTCFRIETRMERELER